MSYSVIDSSKPISSDIWVVSIGCRPQSRQPNHAFILVEGREDNGQALFRRYDFCEDDKNEGSAGKVELKAWPDIDPNQAEQLLFDEIINDDDFASKAWGISKEKAERLHAQIMQTKENPPQYFSSGDRSILGKSLSIEGHNSFTWARKMVTQLDPKRIVMESKWSDYIGSQAVKHLQKPKQRSGWCLTM